MSLVDLNGNVLGSDDLWPIEGIAQGEQEKMEAYVKDSVLTYISEYPNNPISVKTLFGGENWNWGETPLQSLYDKYKNAGNTDKDAFNNAGKNAGTLLKNVLIKLNGKTFWCGKDSNGHNIYYFK
jgi:hypothetical protein